MIALDQDQLVTGDTEYAVVVGGDYPDDALVECYRVMEPEQVVAFYASFIANGTYP